MSWDVLVAMNFSTDEDPVGTFPENNQITGTVISQHKGRDLGLLKGTKFAEFENSFIAVNFALSLQKAFAMYNKGIAPNMQIGCRISINHRALGATAEFPNDDEIDDGFKLLSVADPHGISMSRTIFDEVRSKLNIQYDTNRPIEQCGYLCQNIRRNLGTLDLLVSSAVRIPPSAIQASL